MIGCGVHKDSNPIIPTLVGKTESVVPSINKVGVGVDTTIDNNTKIGIKIDDQSKIIKGQKLAIIDALAQADKLKVKIETDQKISLKEITNLIDKLNEEKTRNMFLETNLAELKTLKNDQAVVLAQLRVDLSEAKVKVTLKESEADTLRDQATFLAGSLQSTILSKDKTIGQLEKDLSKAKQTAATNAVYKNWVIGLVCAFVLWTIIKNVMMAYSPLTKFRI